MVKISKTKHITKKGVVKRNPIRINSITGKPFRIQNPKLCSHNAEFYLKNPKRKFYNSHEHIEFFCGVCGRKVYGDVEPEFRVSSGVYVDEIDANEED